MSDAHRYCTFLLEGQLYGVPIGCVHEVLRHQPVTRVASGSQSIQGLINLRGRIVAVLDLRIWLGMAPRPAGAEPANVVVQAGGRMVSLWVDEVAEVVTGYPDDYESDDTSHDRPGHEGVRGIYKLSDRLLQVLDVPEILEGAMK
jgi:purine-binding chemotaxis protein CheW